MLAYLVNQYPQPSQSFIRREIAALEADGRAVERFTVRRYDGPLVDERDQVEQAKTTSVLEQGVVSLLKDTLATVVTRPGTFLRALRTAWRRGGQSGRGTKGRLVYLVYLAEAATLRRLLAERNVAHVHAHFGTNSAEVAMLCRLIGGPAYSFTVHGPEEFDAPVALALGEKMRHAALVVAVSSFGRSQLWRWADFADWEKVHVVHCGVDQPYLEAEPTPVPDNNRFVCVGRLAEQKGQLVLMRAVRQLRDEGTDVHVTLIGDGPLRAEIERFVAENDLSAHITLAGWAGGEAVKAAILDARATVLPSFAEGLPVAIMESLALARPCVTTYVAGIPELVRPGEGGWLVPAGDSAALAVAMRQVLATKPDELSRQANLGVARVRARHDSRQEAALLAKLIEAAEPATTVMTETPVPTS